MESMINQTLALLLNLAATYPAICSFLIVLGGVVFFATMLKPVVYIIVNMTKTTKDNVIVDKFYGIIDGTAIDFKPFVDLFKKRYPRFEIFDKDKR